MKKLSLVTSLLLLTSSAAFAESSSIKEAFSKGTTTGDLTVYSEYKDNKANTKDSGFTAGSIGLTYTTDSVNGFSATVGFRANTELDEVEYADYALANKASVTEANVKYETDKAIIILGRQAIDLEWLGDYNDAAVAVLNYVPDTSIVLGYTNQKAEIDSDTNDNFTQVTPDGAYVVDVKYAGIDSLEINPYYYSAPKVADFYGIKGILSTDMFGLTAQYATSNEKVAGTADGEIYAVEGSVNVAGVSLAVGYFETDKTGGVASMSAWGDNINPFDDGSNAYVADADTTYGSISYSIADLSLTALYGTTNYGTSDTDELNLIANYSFTDELSANITYVDYDDTTLANDYNKVYASVTYAF